MKDKKALRKLGREILQVSQGILRPDWRQLPEIESLINSLPDKVEAKK